MKLHSKTLRATLFAVTGVVLGAAAAKASVTVTAPASGDIFVAFRATDGQGSSTSYIVNVGQYSQFRDATPGSTITLNVGNIGADLVATYGSDWNTRGDVSWGVFGVSPGASPTLYASKEQPTVGVQSDPWIALSAANRTSTANQISPVLQGIGGYQGSTSTDNSNFGVLQTNSSSASSYYKQVGTGGTSDFGSLSGWNSIEGNFGDGTAGTALDLYRIGTTGVTTPGYFTISDSGVLSFTSNVSPVPEPSVTLVAAAGLLLGISRRRRSA
ncbi:hypothetical protein KBB96_02335 [Luteolibacter ambystomatis]|uniref:PEP-CTERM sorting domain-containing protein n=1 Tax=Luteolibacter ambystomatis TaxID=2824561 RepID=A0A975J0G3_9BACT|nr:hypothetical protein [Luteolibacter ambystomatis]QUE51736.1 hypothetical protein KBB96_02335 [Luteolibacter ambystomatis]